MTSHPPCRSANRRPVVGIIGNMNVLNEQYAVHADALGMPASREKLAITSVTYNRGVGSMRDHPVLEAIDSGNRAEAWYQLRYNCWGSNASAEAGLRKRQTPYCSAPKIEEVFPIVKSGRVEVTPHYASSLCDTTFKRKGIHREDLRIISNKSFLSLNLNNNTK